MTYIELFLLVAVLALTWYEWKLRERIRALEGGHAMHNQALRLMNDWQLLATTRIREAESLLRQMEPDSGGIVRVKGN